MYYSDKDWLNEDRIYSPKRKVNNHISRNYHHIIGSFYSNRMKKVVEYESLNECILYFLMELIQEVVRYYIQPVEIKIPYLDNNLNKKNWTHVPDVLVYKNGAMPYLYQVKEPNQEVAVKENIINRYANEYALASGWCYKVLKPKTLPPVVISNINFLVPFTKKRLYYDSIVSEIVYKLMFLEETTIEELSNSFRTKMSSYEVKPVIYYLIATGVFSTNLFEQIDNFSMIKIKENTLDYLNKFFLLEEG
jgi:hypothetical protein